MTIKNFVIRSGKNAIFFLYKKIKTISFYCLGYIGSFLYKYILIPINDKIIQPFFDGCINAILMILYKNRLLDKYF